MQTISQASDLAAVAGFRTKLASGDEELLPTHLVDRLVSGDHPVSVWREHRSMGVGELAAAAGLSQPYVSQIESGRSKGSTAAMRKIAGALRVDLDDIV